MKLLIHRQLMLAHLEIRRRTADTQPYQNQNQSQSQSQNHDSRDIILLSQICICICIVSVFKRLPQE